MKIKIFEYTGHSHYGKPHFGYLIPFLKIRDLVEIGANVIILFADLHCLLDHTKEQDIKKRLEWYQTLIPGLTKEGKMSSSILGSKIDYDDSEEVINEKIKKRIV